MYIRQLISSMRIRPKMYVEQERIEYIFYLILGYCAALSHCSTHDMDKMFCNWFNTWLIRWIEENVDSQYIAQSVTWYTHIKKIANREEDEVPLFFELCTLFFEDYDKMEGYFEWRKDIED